MAIHSAIEPLIRRKVFPTEESAVRELTRDYVLRHIDVLQSRIRQFECRYGMRFEYFREYLHERSQLLTSGQLGGEKQTEVGQAIMQEEDDWLEWKAAIEMLESWLGLSQEIGT